MKLHPALALVFASLFISASCGHAALRLPAILGDHMVLQSGKADALWGWSEPGDRVEAVFRGADQKCLAKAEAIADAQGRWSLALAAPAAASGKIEVRTQKGESRLIDDVITGEVWFGSGQSNMSYPVKAYNAPAEMVATAQKEAADAHSELRFFVSSGAGADEPRDDVAGAWVVATPETVGACSAVAWNFGVALRQKLHSPVGLIIAAVGGTPVECWIPRTEFNATSCAPAIWARNQQSAAQKKFRQDLEQWLAQNPTPQLQAKNRSSCPKELYSAIYAPTPSRLYNGKVHGLEPYTLKGIVWFQADGNEVHPEEYPELICALIKAWRQHWNDELPFYYIELNGIHPKQKEPAEAMGLAFIRDAQNGALALPKVGVVSAVDLGFEDGHDAHFPNKKPVGTRLAALVLNDLYGQPGLVNSPHFAGCAIEGEKVRVHLDDAEGLRTHDGGALKGFAIRGPEGPWKWADGKIDGREILLWNQEIPHPAAVRYAWGANPVISVENKAGLPLRPFRTDHEAMKPYPSTVVSGPRPSANPPAQK